MDQQLGIFEVTQDVENLHGNYLVRAIVAATDGPHAFQCVLHAVAGDSDRWKIALYGPPIIEASRLTARRIGLALDVRPDEIFAIVYDSRPQDIFLP